METDLKQTRAARATRWIAVLLLPFLVTAGVLLTLFPGRTDRLFAWTINPPMTALLMGAGYLSGVYFFLRIARGAPWQTVHLGFLPITAFTWIEAIATLLHFDRFHHQHVAFFAWLALYVVTPFLVPGMWFANRRAQGVVRSLPDGTRLPAWAAVGLGAIGMFNLAVGLLLFLTPGRLIPLWPWELTPLTARVTGGWFVLPALVDLGVALDRRWTAARIVLQTQLVGLAFILLGQPRALGDFDQANLLSVVFVGGMSALFLALLALYALMERPPSPEQLLLRRPPQIGSREEDTG